MKRIIPFFFLLISIFHSKAQDIDGKWIGHFIQYVHNRYEVELDVEKLPPGNIFSARMRVMDNFYYGEYNVSGYICNKKFLEITTIVLLYENRPGSWIDCLNGTFDLNDDETLLTFTDTWLQREQKNNACKVKYIQKDMFQCLRSAYLHKPKYQSEITAFEQKWIDVKQPKLLATKIKKPETKKPEVKEETKPIPDNSINIATNADFQNTETKIVAKNEDRAPIIDTFETVQTRQVVVKDEIEVSQKEITIEYWDRYNEDGDSVNIFLNKKPILKNVLLTKERKSITIQLEQKVNYLVLDAINQGTEPPNTASITVKDGKKIQNISLTSNMQRSGALKIVYKKPDK
ncbi:MAG: hypothetical protein R2739_07170 [Chitinophagales bacterium]